MSTLIIHKNKIYTDSKNLRMGGSGSYSAPKYAKLKGGLQIVYLGARESETTLLSMIGGIASVILLKAFAHQTTQFATKCKDCIAEEDYLKIALFLATLGIEQSNLLGIPRQLNSMAYIYGDSIIFMPFDEPFKAKKDETFVLGWGEDIIPSMIEMGYTPHQAIREYAKRNTCVGGQVHTYGPDSSSVMLKKPTSHATMAIIHLVSNNTQLAKAYDALSIEQQGVISAVAALFIDDYIEKEM